MAKQSSLPITGDRDMHVNPRLTSSRYLIFSFLLRCVSNFAKEVAGKYDNLSLLDVGCGMKPYEVFFKKGSGRRVTNIGIDQNSNSPADVVAVGENIPFRTGSFEIALCTQVLEHTWNPERVLEEIHRVLVNNGLLLISTHGVWIEGHEFPDLWRWTRSGLTRLLQLSGYKVNSYYSMPSFTSLIDLAHSNSTSLLTRDCSSKVYDLPLP